MPKITLIFILRYEAFSVDLDGNQDSKRRHAFYYGQRTTYGHSESGNNIIMIIIIHISLKKNNNEIDQ